MRTVDPGEYQLEFFREEGFVRRIGGRCREYYWTLNPDFEEPQDTPCVDYWFDRIRSRGGMTVEEAREVFLSFFERRGHERVSPRPVVARWREDLYLTIASIVVFQPHVTSGLVPPPANPLVISQPSIRLEDIDNVGLTIGRHLTSFEMAAHHAFNYPDKYVYWKEETVRLAFEFFTKELGIPADMIVFKESWWEGGGNAGPSFEVAVGGLELATLVFMKYRVTDGGYEEIPLKIVDTGYGVERLAWFTQKTPTAFHAIYGDLLPRYRGLLGVEEPDERLLWEAFRRAGRLDPEEEGSLEAYIGGLSSSLGMSEGEVRDVIYREARVYSILDHAKTLALMLGDGIVPSNSGEGYLARLVARRALRQLILLGSEASLADLVDLQIDYWGRSFPQLRENRDYILDAVSLEEERFRESLRKGSREVARLISRAKNIALNDLVRLYDSHGIPPEIVAEEASKRGVRIEVPRNFYSIVASMHRGPGRVRGYGFEKADLPSDVVRWASGFGETRRLFHEDPYMRSFKARLLGSMGRFFVLDATAFYPTGGGQIHDTGYIVVRGRKYRVVRAEMVGGVIVHEADSEIVAEPGDPVEGVIDWERRYRIMRHHTVTHVLIGALRRILGSHVWQAGAEKTEEKGRLDFTHHRPLTREQVALIEREVNRVIDERRRVWEELVDKGVAEEEYGFSIYQGGVPMDKRIRLVYVDGWDVEACFGTHVRNTGEIGGFKVIGYSRIQDGVIRLEYVAGPRVAGYASELEERLEAIGSAVRAPRGQELERVRGLVERLEAQEEVVRRYRGVWESMVEGMVEGAEPVGGVRVVVVESVERDRRAVQEVMRRLTSRHGDLLLAVVVREEGGVQLELASGVDAGSRIDLSSVARELASRLGGRGGGRGTRASVSLPAGVSTDEIDKAIKELVVMLGAGGG